MLTQAEKDSDFTHCMSEPRISLSVDRISTTRSKDFRRTRRPALGVKRVRVGSALSRCALGAFLHAAREIRGQGTFLWSTRAAKFSDITTLLTR